jgi:hypothetical protein
LQRRVGDGATAASDAVESVKLHTGREICVRRVRRTQTNVTKALAPPKEQHSRERK